MTEKNNPENQFIIKIYTFEYYVKFSFWVSVVFEKCKVYFTKSQYSFCISLNLSQKGHNSLKNLQMTSKFKLSLYFIMPYPSVKFE